jgi:hypothetical protein
MTRPKPEQDALRFVWDRQSVWSRTANALKDRLQRSRVLVLALSVAAAVLVTSGAQLASLSSATGKVLAWLGAAAAAVSAVFSARAGRDAVADWTRARSTSEALKAEVYLYLAGVAPYRDADRLQRLKSRTDGILRSAGDLEARTAGVDAEPRDLPAVSDVPTYTAERVTRQIDGYYRPRARTMDTLAGRFATAATGLAIVAALLSAGAAVLAVDEFAAWLPVVTTVSAALAAHAGAQRYDGLALEYSRTATQLERLRLDEPDPATADAAALDTYVQQCEQVISVQNEAWMALSVTATTPPTPPAPPAGDRPQD